ncbi:MULTISPECIES: Rv1733c family protein [Actinomadura]|uniref:Rv1733c family protein n=1 Tax=Actinomadura TaxID=1988 RepID=UPI0003AD193A|nr:hypothetical protein [Actinomadura madurae]SPT58101.1 Uncharacterised protein [Actinomadura madurae]
MKPVKVRARADRWRRRFGFDGNDLRRHVDRLQWKVGLFLLVLFLSVSPPLCAHVVQTVHDSGTRTEKEAAATRHRVSATVVKIEELKNRHRVTVAWTEPDGTRRTDDYTAWGAPAAGDRLTVWVGPGTVSTSPPPGRGWTITRTVTAGAGTLLAAGLPPLGVYLLVRRRCDRLRYRLWDAAWTRFDNHHIGP